MGLGNRRFYLRQLNTNSLRQWVKSTLRHEKNMFFLDYEVLFIGLLEFLGGSFCGRLVNCAKDSMIIKILNLLLKYTHFLPSYFFECSHFYPNGFRKSSVLFETIEYQFASKSGHFPLIYLSLLINIWTIVHDIQKLMKNKKVVNIISIIILYEKETKNEYMDNLAGSILLYSAGNILLWPIIILSHIIKKLETYNSFKKISIIIKITLVNPV